LKVPLLPLVVAFALCPGGASGAESPPRLTLTASATEAFVGELLTLALVIDVPEALAARFANQPVPSVKTLPKLDILWLTAEFGFRRTLAADQWLCQRGVGTRGMPFAVEPFWYDPETGTELAHLSHGPLPVWAEPAAGAADGMRRYRLAWSFVLEAETTLVFNPVRLELGGTTVESGKVEVQVKKPPELLSAAPRLNLGVGRYEVETSLQDIRATVGRDIVLSVAIRGDGSLASLGRPALTRLPAFRHGDFDLRPAGETWSGDGSVRVFRYFLTPRRSGILEIPPLPFAAFDPRGKPAGYVLGSAAGMTLDVRPALAGDRREQSAGSRLPERLRLRGEPADLLGTETTWPPLWALLLLGVAPPAAWFGCWLWLRHGDALLAAAGRRRRSPAARRALRELGSAAQADETMRVLQRFLSERFGARSGEWTPREIDGLLAEVGASAATHDRMRAALERCEQARFGMASAESRETAALAATLIEELDRLP
jgi:hypothetical protein